MAKRGNNEGSISKRKDGRWVARITLPGGQRKAYYGNTRQDASKLLTAAMRDKDRGVPVVTENQSVAKFVETWLKTVEPTIRPRTYVRYEQYVRLHVVPGLGSLKLTRLIPQHLQTLYAQKLGEALSPTTVAHLHAVLHKALSQAEKWGLVARNVAALVDPPRITRTEMKTFSPEQARQFLSALREDRLEALYALAITTGMREGEILGLHWKDVDLDGTSLQVTGTMQRTKFGLVFSEPKTTKSRRQVTLARAAVDALRRHRTRQLEERLAAGSAWEDNDLVFPNEVGRPIESQNLLRRSFYPLLKKIGLPHIRFHDLRHTAATLMLGRGVHPKVVAEMLGHSQIAVTLDLYSHVTPTMQRDAATAMDSLLREPVLSLAKA